MEEIHIPEGPLADALTKANDERRPVILITPSGNRLAVLGNDIDTSLEPITIRCKLADKKSPI